MKDQKCEVGMLTKENLLGFLETFDQIKILLQQIGGHMKFK
jgi:hypothetical protein